MKKTLISAACALSLAATPASALAAPAHSAWEHGTAATTTSTVSAQDSAWLQSAIQGDLAAVQAAQLAPQRTSNPAALGLANWILKDHTRLLQRAEQVATKLGVTIPTTASAPEQAQLATLAGLTGRSFVATFAAYEITDHQQFIAMTQQEIAGGTSGMVRAAARFYLPIMERHLRTAQGVEAAVNKP